MKSKNIIIVFCSIIGLATIVNSCILFNERGSTKTVVIDVIKVFNEFNLKKDLEKRVAVKLNNYSSGIDSLKAVYTSIERTNSEDPRLGNLTVDIDTLQDRLQKAYLLSDKNINEQVWVRLNTLINEFGKQNSYRLMIGANGMGTVLYNESEMDKTEDLIKYINSKYEIGH